MTEKRRIAKINADRFNRRIHVSTSPLRLKVGACRSRSLRFPEYTLSGYFVKLGRSGVLSCRGMKPTEKRRGDDETGGEAQPRYG